MTAKKKICWISIIVFVGIIVPLCLALIITSVHVLDTSQVGIAYYSATGKIDSTILYSQGTHSLGPFSRFIAYPTSIVSELITLNTRTGDGLAFALTVSFQYHISPDLNSILTLLTKWGEGNYNNAIYRIAMNSIRDSCANFNISQFVFNRTQVETAMNSNLNLALSNEQVVLDNFQLLTFTYPANFANAISSTQGIALQIKTALSQQAQTLEQLQGLMQKSVI